MRFDILTLFPEMFPGPLGTSILKRGMQAGRLGVRLHQIRDYTDDRHHTVDDYPYGGGPGMVMKAPPLFDAVEAALALPPGPPGLYLWSRAGATGDRRDRAPTWRRQPEPGARRAPARDPDESRGPRADAAGGRRAGGAASADPGLRPL